TQLDLNLVERPVERVAIRFGDDPLGRQHRRVGPRLFDVVGTEAPVKPDRIVQGSEVGVLRFGEPGHGCGHSTLKLRANNPSTAQTALRPSATTVELGVLASLPNPSGAVEGPRSGEPKFPIRGESGGGPPVALGRKREPVS